MIGQPTSKPTCPSCGAEVPPDAPRGYCLKCLFALGTAEPDSVAGGTSPFHGGQKSAAAALRKTIVLSLPLTEKPGDRIGRYKLLQRIGEGGCGVVYMAEQTEPVRRKVALKVIKLGMDTKQVVARFEAERQALALMDHPNIAKVFDAGATDAGRPYFVMELVRGIWITDYCDQHSLSTAERLRLFIQVCRAIQHAHYKGIIHRDIKPSNVLVTEVDGVPTPKIIDFGIAKAIGPRLTDKTLFTQFEQLLGTPAYASPEQVGLGGMDVDARSDIYSLGVLLYELLTGRTPFETKELLQAGLEAFLRVIRETEPPKPAIRLTALSADELTEVAARRQATPQKLNRLVRGEMDWMVMKALEKDRRRRYESAAAFAEDLDRWVEGRPILARPAGPRERAVKWARRKPALAGLVGVCLAAGLLLVAMFAISTVRIRAALHQERLSAYVNGIALADRELSAGNLDQANRVLEEDCQPYLRRWEWHYLKRRAHPEFLAIPTQSGPAPPSMAFSPDGKHLAVPGFVRVNEPSTVRNAPRFCIRIVDATTGTVLRTLGDHGNAITSLAYSPDGRCIASGAQDMINDGRGGARSGLGWKVWEVTTGRQLFRTTRAYLENGSLQSRSVVFSPDSQRIASVNSQPPELTVSDLATGRQLFRANHGISLSIRVVWSPDGRRLVTYQKSPYWAKARAMAVGPARVWDASDGRLVFEHTQGGHMCDFSRDSRWLYISGDSKLRAWDLATGKEVPTFTHVGSGGGGLAVSPDGGKLACTLPTPPGERIMIRDARTGLALHTLQKAGNEMAFSPDGGRLATIRPNIGFLGKSLKTTTCSIWDVNTGELLNVLTGTGVNLEYHPDGRRLATGVPIYEPRDKTKEPADGVVKILDAEAASALFEFPPEFSYPIAFSPVGGYLALCEHTNGTVMAAICDVQTGRKVISIGPIVRGGEQVRVYYEDPTRQVRAEHPTDNSAMENVERYVCDIALSPDGRVLASATDNNRVTDCEVKLWDAQTGRELVTIRRPYDRHVRNLSFSRDGRQLAFSSEYRSGGHTEICDTATGQSIFSKLDGGSPVYSPDGRFLVNFKLDRDSWSLVYGPDGRFLANFLQFWDPQTFRLIRTLRNCVDIGGPSQAITLVFDPAGRRLAATSGKDGVTIKLFDVASGKQLQVLRGSLAPVESLCFTPDGERLVSSTAEGPVRLWDTRTGRCLLTLQSSLDSPNIPWRYAHTRVAVSADGSCIATAGDRVRLWRAASAKTK